MITQISILILLMVGSSNAQAGDPEASPSPAIIQTSDSTADQKRLFFDLKSNYQFSLHSADDPHKQTSLQSVMTTNYFTSPVFRIQGAVGGTQAYRPTLNFRSYNPEFRGFYIFNPDNDQLRYYVGPTLVLPFGSDGQEQSLIFSAGASGRVLLNLKRPDGVGFRGYYDLIFSKNFNHYDTDVFGESNKALSLYHVVYLEYVFSPRWNLNASFSFSSQWNYGGNVSSNYILMQELDFQANDFITLFLSHLRGGDFLSPDGQTYSFGIFGADDSRISLGVDLSF